jgi:hypothetical protein
VCPLIGAKEFKREYSIAVLFHGNVAARFARPVSRAGPFRRSLVQPGDSALHDGHFLPQVQYLNRVLHFACRPKQSILDESL